MFSKLDLKKGYYQVKVDDENICKTVVITPFGLWEFLRMPFDYEMRARHSSG